MLIVPLFLAACAGNSAATPTAGPEIEPTQAASGESSWGAGTLLVDDQGEVTVEVAPLNLTGPGETLDFQVKLDTHSVDLSMNLAELATLATDTGITVQAANWDAPLGGHHVEGTLSFPATVDGTPLLAEASTITLTIADLDVQERTFVWER